MMAIKGVASCGIWQYSHRLATRRRTMSRVAASMLGRMAGEKAAGFRLDDRNHVDGFDEVLIGCFLVLTQRPRVGLLPKAPRSPLAVRRWRAAQPEFAQVPV